MLEWQWLGFIAATVADCLRQLLMESTKIPLGTISCIRGYSYQRLLRITSTNIQCTFQAKAKFFGQNCFLLRQKKAAKNEKKTFFWYLLNQKTQFIPSSESEMPEIRDFLLTMTGWGELGRVILQDSGTVDRKRTQANDVTHARRPSGQAANVDAIAAIFKVWRHIRNTTTSIDAYLPEEQSCQISSSCDLKRRSLRLFWGASPKEEDNDEQRDQFLIK